MLFEADCEFGGANSSDSYPVYKLLHHLTDSCRLAGQKVNLLHFTSWPRSHPKASYLDSLCLPHFFDLIGLGLFMTWFCLLTLAVDHANPYGYPSQSCKLPLIQVGGSDPHFRGVLVRLEFPALSSRLSFCTQECTGGHTVYASRAAVHLGGRPCTRFLIYKMKD